MTHNFLRDKEYVRSMLGSPAAYVGMLGPAARTERLLMELADEGVEIGEGDASGSTGRPASTSAAKDRRRSRRRSSRRSSPSSADRAGGFLRDRPGPIHDRPRPGHRSSIG